jgi:membrane-associated protease RseP (regulator of RpoE activity)
VKDPFAEVDVKPARTATIGALIVAGAVVAAIVEPKVTATVAVILAFFVMIMLHELGHFVMAKRAGMKVTEFFVGFGPRLWSVKKGDTEYGLKAIVAGGYCRIVGMNNLDPVEAGDEDRAYTAKPFHQQFGVAVAGSTVHFILAIVLMFFVLWQAGNPNSPKVQPVFESVEHGLPAANAGLRSGDRVLAVDGQKITSWDQVRRTVERNPEHPLRFTVEHDGVTRTVTATPRVNPDLPGREGQLGVSAKLSLQPMSLPSSVTHAFTETYNTGKLSVQALGKVFSPSGVRAYTDNLTGNHDSSSTRNDNSSANAPAATNGSGSSSSSGTSSDDSVRFISPLGFFRLAGQAVQVGWVSVFLLLIVINVFVGVFNMVPLPPFDGGLVAIAIYEKIASTVRGERVRVDMRKLIPVTAVVVAVLLFIGISALFLDIVRPQQNPF